MKHANPLDLLIENSRKSRDLAGRALAEDRQTRQQAVQQLETLRHYRQEYNRRLHDALCHGMDVVALENYRQFIHSLENAIGSADCHLEQRTQKVAASQQHWQHQQKRLSSYDTLAHRRALREQETLTRQEQRQNDEFANNQQARQRTRQDGSGN